MSKIKYRLSFDVETLEDPCHLLDLLAEFAESLNYTDVVREPCVKQLNWPAEQSQYQ